MVHFKYGVLIRSLVDLYSCDLRRSAWRTMIRFGSQLRIPRRVSFRALAAVRHASVQFASLVLRAPLVLVYFVLFVYVSASPLCYLRYRAIFSMTLRIAASVSGRTGSRDIDSTCASCDSADSVWPSLSLSVQVTTETKTIQVYHFEALITGRIRV